MNIVIRTQYEYNKLTVSKGRALMEYLEFIETPRI